jgi:hypothetical protein
MKNAFEMGSGAMIGSGIQKLIRGLYRHMDSMEVT